MDFQIENNILTATLNNGSYRKFRTTFPGKFKAYGFGAMNVYETLSSKIMSGDYSSCVTDTELELGFTISNGKKEFHCKLQLEEVFTPINLDPINLNLISDDLKPHFMSLQNQINYLKSKMSALIEENESLKNTDYYSDYGC